MEAAQDISLEMFGSAFIQASLEKHEAQSHLLPALFPFIFLPLPPTMAFRHQSSSYFKAVTGDELIDALFQSLQRFLLGVPRTGTEQRPEPRKLLKAADDLAGLTKRETVAEGPREAEVALWVFTALLLRTADMCAQGLL